MTAFQTTVCDICNATAIPVRNAVVAWVVPIGPRYEAVTRCVDEQACRQRVAEAGERWPVLEKGERA